MDIVERPWGHFQIIDEGRGFKVKRIVVKPKCRLSLQAHMMREERWCGVSGKGKVTIGNGVFELVKGSMSTIPAGRKHRAENIGEDNLIFIEVQLGDVLSEEDIVRYEDDYGRT
jgi:mannose-6-phosphate isomerase-like protein (cupin superfamily)